MTSSGFSAVGECRSCEAGLAVLAQAGHAEPGLCLGDQCAALERSFVDGFPPDAEDLCQFAEGVAA